MRTWHKLILGWVTWMAASGRPATTLGLRRYQLMRFAEDHQYRSPWSIDVDEMAAWIASHAGWSTETRRSYRAALRRFYEWGHATGRTDHNPAKLLPPITPAQHLPRPTPESLLRDALGRATPRVRLMITLAARLGLRRGEIARIHARDIVEDLSGWSLLVHGKGNKDRLIPLPNDVASELREHDGWLFPGAVDGHLSAPYVGKLVRLTLASAGWTTHTLRHRFATVAYAGSRDLLSVQTLLGHSSPETTRRYVQLPQDALRAAMSFAA